MYFVNSTVQATWPYSWDSNLLLEYKQLDVDWYLQCSSNQDNFIMALMEAADRSESSSFYNTLATTSFSL